MKFLGKSLFPLALLFSLQCLFANEKFRLCKVEYNSQGKTKPENITQIIPPVNHEKIFETREELESYLKQIRQNLDNTRLLLDITYEYETVQTNEDGISEIKASYTFRDSNSMIIFPIGTFDSNKGLKFEIAMKDNNFIGLTNPLRTGITLNLGDKEEPTDFSIVTPGFNISYDMPWFYGITKNLWINSIDFQWCTRDRLPTFSFTTGFMVGIPFGSRNQHEIDFTFKQGIVRDIEYSKFGDEFYLIEFAEIAVPLEVGNIGLSTPVRYKPLVSFEYNWDSDSINKENCDLRQTPLLKPGHELYFERIDWIGKNNYRDGFSFKTGTYLGFDLHKKDVPSDFFVPSFESQLSLYKGFDYVGFNLHISSLFGKNTKFKTGKLLRGATDNQVFTHGIQVDANNYALDTPNALVFNAEIPIHLFTAHWPAVLGRFGKKMEKILQYFDFEMQLSPFVDFALIENRGTEKKFSIKEGIYTAGFEFLAYPLKFKSFMFRASFGFDLSKIVLDGKYGFDSSWRDGKNWELYAGLGFQF